MRTCSVCGFHHLDTDTVCVRCGSALVAADPTEAFIADRSRDSPPRRVSGGALSLLYRLRGRTARFLYAALRPFRAPLAREVEERRPFSAAFLSLIPGAGQLYNRQPWKAGVFVAVWILLLFLSAWTFFDPRSNRVLLALFLWAVYAFHDGYRTARRINGDPWHLRLSLAFYLAWIFQVAAFCLLTQFLLGTVFLKFRYMSEPALRPVLHEGDRFVLDILTYHFRSPRVGEIVYYRPAQIVLDGGKNMFIEAPVNGIERVVAGPGETFARKGGRYFRNGEPVPDSAGPINRTEVRWDYELKAPEDAFIVIRSYTSADSVGAAAPRMFEVPNVLGWEEACIVPERDIRGRAVLVYHPPEHRGFLPGAVEADGFAER